MDLLKAEGQVGEDARAHDEEVKAKIEAADRTSRVGHLCRRIIKASLEANRRRIYGMLIHV